MDLDGEWRRERALETVTAGLSAAATREEILRSILRVGSEVLASSAAVAYLKRADGQTLRLVAQVGVADDVAATVDGLPLSSNYPVAQAMREGSPAWISSAEVLDREFPEFARALDGAFARQSIVALPLRLGGEVVGGLGFAFPHARAFDQGERSLLTTLAARCETAMERASLYEESLRSRADVEALLRFHEVVSGILAHDLKNPLAAVLMNARILRSESSERARAIGTRIVISSERMARMIEQIVEWTRFHAKGAGMPLTRAVCDVAEIVADVVAEQHARKGDAPIAVDATGDLRGDWDADRLNQALANVVGNALDHATSPGATVSLVGEADVVRIVVTNEGEISPALLPTIFEPFQADGARTGPRRRGLGLGLFITREIVQAHGGSIVVQAIPGSRVAFTVTLPRAVTS